MKASTGGFGSLCGLGLIGSRSLWDFEVQLRVRV